MRKIFFASGILSLMLFILPASMILLPTKAEARSYSSMSCYDLWYARNSIFANKGYCFKGRKAVNTFGRRCYPPYGQLNSWERGQINDIKYWERQNGCRNGYSRRSNSGNISRGYARVVGIRWNDTLAVRSGPSTRYARIGNLSPDATGIEILECTRSWCRVRYGNTSGWAFTKYLSRY